MKKINIEQVAAQSNIVSSRKFKYLKVKNIQPNLSSRYSLQKIKYAWTFRGASADSDHYIVTVILKKVN